MTSSAPDPSAAPAGAGLLAAVRASRAAEDAEALRQMELTLDYAAAHRVEHLDDAAVLPGTDGEVALAGRGAPLVSEFAVVEFAAATGRSMESARIYVGSCLELGHRLPRTWAHTRAGRASDYLFSR